MSTTTIDITVPIELSDHQELQFTGYATPPSVPKLSPGDKVYFLKRVLDDKNIPVYDVSSTKKGKTATESLYADEFQVVYSEESPVATQKQEVEAVKPKEEKAVTAKKTEAKKKPEAVTDKKKVAVKTSVPVKQEEEKQELKPVSSTKKGKTATGKKQVVEPAAELEEEAVTPSQTMEPGMDETTLTLIREHDGNACAAALAIAKDSEAKRFILGGILFYIQKNKSYENEKDSAGVSLFTGHKGFAEFCEKYIGLSYSSAKLYQRIYTAFTSIGLGVDDFRRVGTAKAREIVQLVEADFTKEDVEEAIRIGEEGTHEQLHSHVSTKMQDANVETHGLRDQVKCTTYRFDVFSDQADIVNAALHHAMTAGGIQDTDDNALSRAFISVCSDYLQAYARVEQPVNNSVDDDFEETTDTEITTNA